ncbi:MAG TPA: hypothetical protein VD838_21270, partial [Anaeromyxobacteraceae bacterium]|nr:hypothetical protein [Anaeromyxobacteraceae bacterium]
MYLESSTEPRTGERQMTYFLTRSNRVDHTTTDYAEARDIAAALGATVVTRNDLKTLEQAQELAKQADEHYARVMAAEIDWTYRPSTLDLIRTAAATPTPEDVPVRYLATDTQGRSPRFDVIEAPQVGDEVS